MKKWVQVSTIINNQKRVLHVFVYINIYICQYKYHSQVFLEQCKHVFNEKSMPEDIPDVIENSSDSDREDSDEENSNEKNCYEENYV